MSYTITVRVYQTNPSTFFRIVEKTVWNYANGGTWSENNGEHVLNQGGSGTSGSLRFVNVDNTEAFIATFGVHNYKRWGDIVTNLKPNETGVIITPQYYSNDHKDREAAREQQRPEYSVKNGHGRNIQYNYSVPEGNNLVVNLIIG